MRIILAIAILMTTAACSPQQVEEIVFRKYMEYQVKDLCDEDDRKCRAAVEEQIKSCMETADWRRFLDSEDDEDELQRFIKVFFPCFKDASGKPYFDFTPEPGIKPRPPKSSPAT